MLGSILLVVLVPIAVLAIFRGVLAVRNGSVPSKVNRTTVILAAVSIAVAWALFAATQLGFIPDHAP
jgi:hypothetical protein